MPTAGLKLATRDQPRPDEATDKHDRNCRVEALAASARGGVGGNESYGSGETKLGSPPWRLAVVLTVSPAVFERDVVLSLQSRLHSNRDEHDNGWM